MPLYGGVHQPVGPLDAHEALVGQSVCPAHLDLVVHHADAVAERHCEVMHGVTLVLLDVAIGEGRLLALEADEVVFVVAETHQMLAVIHVEVTFLVHVHDPGIRVGTHRD